jgi:hypothetical protein
MFNLLRIDGRVTNIALHESVTPPEGTLATVCLDIQFGYYSDMTVNLGSFQNLPQLLEASVPKSTAHGIVNGYGPVQYDGTYWLVGTRQANPIYDHTLTSRAYCIAITKKNKTQFLTKASKIKNLPVGANRVAPSSEFSLIVEHAELSEDIQESLTFDSIESAKETIKLSSGTFQPDGTIQIRTLDTKVTSQPACVLPGLPVCIPGTEKALKFVDHTVNIVSWDKNPEITIALEDNWAEPIGWTFVREQKGLSTRISSQVVSAERTLNRMAFKKSYGSIDMIETLVMLEDCEVGDTATIKHYGAAVYFGEGVWGIGIDHLE